ncbi:hypothetical protein AB0D38_08710, partial [Streptomyces sp. NPDC048279]
TTLYFLMMVLSVLLAVAATILGQEPAAPGRARRVVALLDVEDVHLVFAMSVKTHVPSWCVVATWIRVDCSGAS